MYYSYAAFTERDTFSELHHCANIIECPCTNLDRVGQSLAIDFDVIKCYNEVALCH
jgi:hypothetical protein